MRIDAQWLNHPGTRAVLAMIADAGHEVACVGGCVRNTLLDEPVDDIDIATAAPPTRVMELAGNAGMKAVGTGIDHGTVTVISHGLPHEITTFRRDIETDGRRAVVAFSETLEEDAARRDFTINALYARADGTVLDPTGKGLADIAARRVRFIGRAEDRIREDFLRILRFFRFHARYADTSNGFDPEDLAAISSLSGGLETISAERIGQEMRKLLAAPNASPALATMHHIGVLARVLPGADVTPLGPLAHLEHALDQHPHWLRRLAALGGVDTAAALRLSKAEARDLATRRDAIGTPQTPAELGYRLGAEAAVDVILLRGAILETPVARDDLEAAKNGAQARFPIRAADLPGDLQGPEIGNALKALESRWIASDFTLTRDDLLQ